MSCPFSNALDIGQYLDDQSKLGMYKQTAEHNYDATDAYLDSEAAQYKFWDTLSILAFYQNDKQTATSAYKKLIDLRKFPHSQQDRIYRNATYFDSGSSDNISYSVTKKHIAALTNIRPNSIHFVYLKGVDFGLHHYIAIKSAIAHSDSQIYIYNDVEAPEDNFWWKTVKSFPRVHIITIYHPKYLNGHEVTYKQHQADIIRLLVLYYHGGTYLDLDMILIKSIGTVVETNAQLVMCRESHNGVSNAFIHATVKQAPILGEWLALYETGYDRHWTKLSIGTPHDLAEKYTDDMKILSTSTFLPFDYTYTDFFKKPNCIVDFTNSYAIHLWETEASKQKLLPTSLDEFKKQNSVFYQMTRDVLADDYEEMDKDELKDILKMLVNGLATLTEKVDDIQKQMQLLADRVTPTTNTPKQVTQATNNTSNAQFVPSQQVDLSFLQNLIQLK
jgi:hypothetical protein